MKTTTVEWVTCEMPVIRYEWEKKDKFGGVKAWDRTVNFADMHTQGRMMWCLKGHRVYTDLIGDGDMTLGKADELVLRVDDQLDGKTPVRASGEKDPIFRIALQLLISRYALPVTKTREQVKNRDDLAEALSEAEGAYEELIKDAEAAHKGTSAPTIKIKLNL